MILIYRKRYRPKYRQYLFSVCYELRKNLLINALLNVYYL